ncbi:DMT family transporter [Fibrella aquatilis]|uniref:DMT family transporter n=1 Tax=Fibrella aquatilis TaxID=2817059 RepID=A0A939G7B2_9BACT|nr:DMT family transporter [Fibrella aquatilis]MBO0931964.1 DMT family transporter [Fibrella aquatilis]
MNQLTLAALAFVGGICLAVQGGLNAQLGVILKNPLMAAVVAFLSSGVIACVVVAFSAKTYPTVQQLKDVPYYLWFSGGLLSVVGAGLYYFTMPKLGISSMIALGLGGQIMFSVIAGHFGLFNLPVQPIDVKRVAGVLAILLGLFLVNQK